MPESVITDEMRSWIGKELESHTIEIEKEPIRRWAESIGDPNPLYHDEAYAKKTRHGAMITPPGMINNYAFGLEGHAGRMGGLRVPPGGGRRTFELPFKFILNGGNEIEYMRPIKAGDVLKVTSRISDMVERQGRPGIGRMFIQTTEITFQDQKGQVVAKARGTMINYEGK
jgi:acyl dehydratase